MTYKLTPVNVLCALLIGFEILFFIVPESLSNETYAYHQFYLIPIILFCILIDYLLQKRIKKYSWLFFIEMAFIIISAVIISMP
jgi:hypothetical protein